MSDDATLSEFTETTPAQERQQTPIGELPTDWEMEWLKDVVEINPDGFSEDDWASGTFEYISLSEASDGEIEDSKTTPIEDAPSRAQRTVQQGDILVGTVRPKQRSHGFVGEKHAEKVCSSGFGVLRSETRLNSRYLLQEILSNRFFSQMEAYVAGSGYPSVKISDLKKHRVAIPPLSEQRNIATVLHTVDQAIQKTEEIIEQVRTIKRGIIQDEMKGRGSNRPLEKKRIGPRTVSLPEDWKVVQIGDAIEQDIILKQQDGNHGSDYPRKDEFVSEGIPYLSAEMLSEGEVDFSQAKYLTEERANELRIGFAQDDDVLLAHNATVGPAGLLKTDRDFVIIGTSLTYYRCNSNRLDSKYLTYFFQSGTFQKQLQDVMRQSTRNQVPITRQQNLNIILPPVDEQREISERIDTVIARLRNETDYHGQLQRLKRGLMQDLLSGTVRTIDTNIEVPEEIAQHG